MLFEPCGDARHIQSLHRNSYSEVLKLLRCGRKPQTIPHKKYTADCYCGTFITICEWVIPDDIAKIHCSFLVQIWVLLMPKNVLAGRLYG